MHNISLRPAHLVAMVMVVAACSGGTAASTTVMPTTTTTPSTTTVAPVTTTSEVSSTTTAPIATTTTDASLAPGGSGCTPGSGDLGDGLWYGEVDSFDTDRIAVIGASVGGNLAYVASGGFEAVDTVVSMSPSPDPGGDALLGEGIEGFSPLSVLFMSDEAEAGDARALAANAADPVEVKVYEGATAHGVELLDNPQAVRDILDWLEQTL